MEAGRKLREEQYAALKDKEWEDTLLSEAELHRYSGDNTSPCQFSQQQLLTVCYKPAKG
jgi:hypothetical protein